jgi:hypothetical protein
MRRCIDRTPLDNLFTRSISRTTESTTDLQKKLKGAVLHYPAIYTQSRHFQGVVQMAMANDGRGSRSGLDLAKISYE